MRKPCTVAAALIAASVLSGCNQPRPRCSIARGAFAARYVLRTSAGSCTPLVGETLDVQAYTAARSERDTRPDFDKTSIAIQPQSLSTLLAQLAERAEPEASDRPYAFGPFADNEPDGDEYCTVPTLTLARVRLPSLPEKVEMCTTYPAEPSADLSYEFSNVRVYTTAGAYGTHFTAKLTRREPNCVAEYDVTAIYPAVACDAPAPEPDGGAGEEDASTMAPPTLDGGIDAMAPDEPEREAGAMTDCGPEEELGPRVPDDALCAAMGDPSQARATGSGINPDFPVYCDPELWLCLPSRTGEVR